MMHKIAPTVDALGNNALHYACWGGNFCIVKSLVEENIIDPSIKNAEGLTAIQFAIAGKHIGIVQYLSKLNSGCLAGDTSDSGLSSLHRAAIYGSLETIKLLLSTSSETSDSAVISVDSTAYNGNTVLHLSAQHGGMDIVQYIVEECRAEVNAQNDYDLTPLHFACLGYASHHCDSNKAKYSGLYILDSHCLLYHLFLIVIFWDALLFIQCIL